MQEANEKEMTFWDHLDELRKVFFRIAIAVILLACIAFLNKELLFDIVLAPQQSDFILYRFFNRLAADFSMPASRRLSCRADQYPVDLTIHDSYEHCVLCRFVARFSLHHLFVVRFYQSGPT